MKAILNDNLGYKVFYKILNSADFGILHTRRRVFVVAIDILYLKECGRENNFSF